MLNAIVSNVLFLLQINCFCLVREVMAFNITFKSILAISWW